MTNQHSHSSLRSFVECPAQWKFRYLDKLEAAPVEGFREGSILHDAIEEYGRWCYSQDVRSDLDRMRAIALRFDDSDLANTLNRFAEGWEYDWSLTVADAAGIEKWFDVALPGDYGRMRGRVDLLQYNEAENALWITDLKSRRPSSAPDECPTQLRLYAWAMLQQYPVERVVCRFVYVHGGEPREWELQAPVSINWATAIIDRLRAETRWEATPGNQCVFCGYTEVCAKREVVPEYPFERAGYMLAMEAWLKQEKAALRRHVDEYGPIPLEGGSLDIRAKEDATRRYKPRRNVKLDLLKAIMASAFAADLESFEESVLEAVAAKLSPFVKFNTERLAELVPLEGNVFAETDAEGKTVDLSHLLNPVSPSRSFGFYPDEEAESDE